VQTESATSYLLVGPNSRYSHRKSVKLRGFTYPVISLDTNRGETLVRLLADSLAPASSPTSAQNTFNTLAKQFTLNTLQQFQANGNKPVPPASYDLMIPSKKDMLKAKLWQNTPTNAVAFFKQVGQSLRLNPLPTRTTGISGTLLATLPSYMVPQADANHVYFVPSAGQQTTLALFRSIGLTQDGFKIPKGWGPRELEYLQMGFENGANYIQQLLLQFSPSEETNYWSYANSGFGTYPNTLMGYQTRAAGVIAGGLPNLPIDGFYAAMFTNSSSQPLDGNNTYSVTFTLPQTSYPSSGYPVTGIEPPLALNSSGSPIGFWSLTLYQPDSSEAAAPFLSQASVLNMAYSTAATPVDSIDTGAYTITVPASNVGPLTASTAIMFGAGASRYGLTPNEPYYIVNTPTTMTQNGTMYYTFQISTKWIQMLSDNGVPIQYSGDAGTPVTLSTPLSANTPLDYGVIQGVSQLGSTQIADGQLKANDGTVAGFPAGSYTIWLSPTLPKGVPATNWIPTPSTAYLQSIYGAEDTLDTQIEPIIRMYDAQPGNMPPSILPLPPDENYPDGLPNGSYVFPLLVQAQ